MLVHVFERDGMGSTFERVLTAVVERPVAGPLFVNDVLDPALRWGREWVHHAAAPRHATSATVAGAAELERLLTTGAEPLGGAELGQVEGDLVSAEMVR